jgi:hypothetical protein
VLNFGKNSTENENIQKIRNVSRKNDPKFGKKLMKHRLYHLAKSIGSKSIT